ncbi:hypothetical protein MMC26_003660 [Xylographa opegraphella]|nr:hypothetical protein [Xylographa opegraphella]
MASILSSPESFDDGQWDPFEDDIPSQQQTQQADQLGFCQLSDWDEGKTYNEHPPTCLHYSMEWKLRINNREVSKETEQDLVLAPASYWRLFLKSKLEEVVLHKIRTKKRDMKSEDTKIVMTVTQQRSEPPLTKSFDEINIDWSVVETQLITWGYLFLAGKKLRVTISFNYNYVEAGQPSATSKNINQRGSTTQRMLTELNTELDIDEGLTGRPAIWKAVYETMRCPGSPCDKGPHCWCDPVGKKHYPLRPRHLKSFIRFVEQGGLLESHSDVPDYIRQQLYAEEQHSLAAKRQKNAGTSVANLPPIHITNTMPTSSCQSCQRKLSSDFEMPPRNSSLSIPGFRDKAVEEYCAWHQSKFENSEHRVEYQKAQDVMKENAMTL